MCYFSLGVKRLGLKADHSSPCSGDIISKAVLLLRRITLWLGMWIVLMYVSGFVVVPFALLGILYFNI
jgi:hypothetical protein